MDDFKLKALKVKIFDEKLGWTTTNIKNDFIQIIAPDNRIYQICFEEGTGISIQGIGNDVTQFEREVLKIYSRDIDNIILSTSRAPLGHQSRRY